MTRKRGGSALRLTQRHGATEGTEGSRARHALPLQKNRRQSVSIGGPICVHLPSSASICVPFTTVPKATPAPNPQFALPHSQFAPPPSSPWFPPLPAGAGGAGQGTPCPYKKIGGNRCKSVDSSASIPSHLRPSAFPSPLPPKSPLPPPAIRNFSRPTSRCGFIRIF